MDYFVVSVLVVSVFVAVPIGVSTFEVDSDFDVSVVDEVDGLSASIVTLVDDEGAGEDGCTIVVDELAGVCSRTTVSFSTVVGSFTTVVEEVEAGRSHAARTPAVRARAGNRTSFMRFSVPWIWVTLGQRTK